MSSNGTSTGAGGDWSGGGGGDAAAGGAGAGAGEWGSITLDQVLWMGLESHPVRMTTAAAMGSVAVALFTGKILMDTGMYYDYFGSVDKAWVKWGVAVGCLASVAHFILTVAQTWILIEHAFTEFFVVSKMESDLGYASDLIGAGLNFAASTYYTWRAYKMSGRKWWLGAVLMVLNVGTLVMGLLVAGKGLAIPSPSLELGMQLKADYEEIARLYRAWGALAMTSDGSVCATMIFYLFKSRTSVFHREKKIYHKLNSLIIETMMPPVICILILDIHITDEASPTGDWRRVLRAAIPSLYFVSLIHSLVARATIRRMLDSNLASEGEHTSNPRSTGSVFVATYPSAEKADGDPKERDLEASTDHIVPLEKISSYHRSASPVSDSSTHPKPSRAPGL